MQVFVEPLVDLHLWKTLSVVLRENLSASPLSQKDIVVSTAAVLLNCCRLAGTSLGLPGRSWGGLLTDLLLLGLSAESKLKLSLLDVLLLPLEEWLLLSWRQWSLFQYRWFHGLLLHLCLLGAHQTLFQLSSLLPCNHLKIVSLQCRNWFFLRRLHWWSERTGMLSWKDRTSLFHQLKSKSFSISTSALLILDLSHLMLGFGRCVVLMRQWWGATTSLYERLNLVRPWDLLWA